MKRKVPTYTIERMPHGYVVRGNIPVSELSGIEAMARAAGFDKLMFGLGGGVSLGITNDEHAAAWRDEIAARAKLVANGDRELEWLRGHDTGVSSLTIFSVFSEKHGAAALASARHADAPYDPSDFGRCYRLLKLFPEWRARIGEVAVRYQGWSGLIGAWAELEALYDEESKSPSGMAPKLYARIQKLRERGVR